MIYPRVTFEWRGIAYWGTIAPFNRPADSFIGEESIEDRRHILMDNGKIWSVPANLIHYPNPERHDMTLKDLIEAVDALNIDGGHCVELDRWKWENGQIEVTYSVWLCTTQKKFRAHTPESALLQLQDYLKKDAPENLAPLDCEI